MSLRTQIEQDLIAAQKSQDKQRLETLRFLLSAIKYKEVDTKEPLTDEQVVDVVSKQVKTHRESIDAFKKGRRPDLVAKEEAQLKILEAYLPTQMGEAEVREIVSRAIKQYRDKGEKVEMGLVMKAVMPQLKGKADGNLVRTIVDEALKE